MIRNPAHKQPLVTLGDYIEQVQKEEDTQLDLDSDEPLGCPLDKADGETCESCQ